MAHSTRKFTESIRRLRHLGCVALAPCFAFIGTASASGAEMFLRAADSGECIENVVFKTLTEQGNEAPMSVVATALRALSQRHEQQRALGCEGDIAAQAIAAGLDPDQVLAATAAGL